MTARVLTLKGAGVGSYYTERMPNYYTQTGEPAGVWAGKGAERLGLVGVVEPEAFGHVLSGVDPSGTYLLGRRMGDTAVRGFDVTFSAPKSVSVLWALGDEAIQREVLAAHDAAVSAVVGWVEAHAHTRLRVDGEVVVVDAEGIIAALFRQHTSRALDPQLHTHAVIANRVLAPDGRWLALDARTLKLDQRTVSALYHAGLRAELTQRLGLRWELPVNGIAELADVPAGLRAEFSLRSLDVTARVDVKRERFVKRLGREPTLRERWRLEREAVVDSRPPKTRPDNPLELRAMWQSTARDAGYEPGRVVRDLLWGNRTPSRAIDRAIHAAVAVEALEGRQSTWRLAEIAREAAASLPTTFAATAPDVVAEVERVSAVAQRRMVELSHAPAAGAVCRRDGRPITEAATDHVLTTRAVLAQEEEILEWAADRVTTGGTPNPAALSRSGVVLSHGQAEAAVAVAGDAKLVLIVGPAGAGKTTALAPAVAQLQAEGRRVFAVAPSAVAADVLRDGTGVAADTSDKLLYEHTKPAGPAPAYRLDPGATVIVDEAGMLSTPNLHALTQLADARGWRVVLIGDPLQFSAVGRGGMFGILCEQLPVIALDRVQRFTHPWERDASLRLRAGDGDVVELYDAHGRVRGGTLDEMQRRVVDDWAAARSAGREAVMLAATNDSVVALNGLAQRERVAAGVVDPKRAVVAGVYRVHVGDEVVTRRNDRYLVTDRGLSVANRDHWTVTRIRRDGTITATGNKGLVTLPAGYVREFVELGYAQTAHAAQGRTVDHSLLLVDGPVDARAVYVPMTRGRETNTAYVVTPAGHSAVEVLSEAVSRDWIDRPAHTVERALLAPGEIDTLLRDRARAARAIDELWRADHHTRLAVAPLNKQWWDLERHVSDARRRINNAQRYLDRYDRPWRIRRGDINRSRHDLAAAHADLERLLPQQADLNGLLDDVTQRHQTAESDYRRLGGQHRERIERIDWQLQRDTTERGRRALADPPRYLTRLLGEPPRDRDGRRLWRDAAGTIEQARVQHHIHHPEALLSTNAERSGPEQSFVHEARHAATTLRNDLTREHDHQALRIGR